MSSRKSHLIIGIETSCDETACSVIEINNDPIEEITSQNIVELRVNLLSDIIASQIPVHSDYGGVVPELASRMHVTNIVPVVKEAIGEAGICLKDLSAIAVSQCPGLLSSLVVGMSFAKALSVSLAIPLVGVNHIYAHLCVAGLEHRRLKYPHVGLIVSGGHTGIYIVESPLSYRLIGQTRDDAAGEAFDKVAKALGLPYPGGPKISALATEGNREAFRFPRSWMRDTPYDFSFSGLKTAVIQTIRRISSRGGGGCHIPLKDIAASFEASVVDVLVEKTLKAALQYNIKDVVVAGGVASNSYLRAQFIKRGKEVGASVLFPSQRLCTDNGVMIAFLGGIMFMNGITTGLDEDVYSRAV